MATQTIGYVTYDPDDTGDTLFFQWSSALDLDQATALPDALWAGYDAVRDMAPSAMLAEEPLTEETARRLYRAQVWLSRSHYARLTASQVPEGDYQLADLSRRYWLEARSTLRPRDWGSLQ